MPADNEGFGESGGVTRPNICETVVFFVKHIVFQK